MTHRRGPGIALSSYHHPREGDLVLRKLHQFWELRSESLSGMVYVCVGGTITVEASLLWGWGEGALPASAFPVLSYPHPGTGASNIPSQHAWGF